MPVIRLNSPHLTKLFQFLADFVPGVHCTYKASSFNHRAGFRLPDQTRPTFWTPNKSLNKKSRHPRSHRPLQHNDTSDVHSQVHNQEQAINSTEWATVGRGSRTR